MKREEIFIEGTKVFCEIYSGYSIYYLRATNRQVTRNDYGFPPYTYNGGMIVSIYLLHDKDAEVYNKFDDFVEDCRIHTSGEKWGTIQLDEAMRLQQAMSVILSIAMNPDPYRRSKCETGP